MNQAIRAVFAGIIGLVASSSAMADGPKAPPIEPEAKARLDALIAAYRALPAYSDHGEVTLVVKVGDRELKQTHKASIRFARPNKLDVQTDLVRVVCDGSNVTASVAPLKKYLTTPAPKKFAESSLRGGPLGAIEFGGVAGLPLVHVLNLVIGDEPERLIYDFTPKVLTEPDREVNGVSYRVLRLDESDNHDWRFLIDPKTGLLTFVDLVVEGDATKSSIAGGDTHVETLRWAAGAISTEPPPADSFAFLAPAGFTRIAHLEGAEAPLPPKIKIIVNGQVVEPAQVPGHPMIGQPAPDFTLDVLDGPDKIRKMSKADLTGKVVLIDFWATWCDPCLKELPDVQALINGYAKAKKNVVVVALSIDRAEAGDLKEARAKVEATLKEMKMTLAGEGNPVGQIALDPLGRIAEFYGVKAIPFAVVIDTKGIVRAVHMGLTSREVFAEEIDALLADKPVGEVK